jgi:hypothetical protein
MFANMKTANREIETLYDQLKAQIIKSLNSLTLSQLEEIQEMAKKKYKNYRDA